MVLKSDTVALVLWPQSSQNCRALPAPEYGILSRSDWRVGRVFALNGEVRYRDVTGPEALLSGPVIDFPDDRKYR